MNDNLHKLDPGLQQHAKEARDEIKGANKSNINVFFNEEHDRQHVPSPKKADNLGDAIQNILDDIHKESHPEDKK